MKLRFCCTLFVAAYFLKLCRIMGRLTGIVFFTNPPTPPSSRRRWQDAYCAGNSLFLSFLFHVCPSCLCRLCCSLFRLRRSGNCLPSFGSDAPEIFLNRLVHSCSVPLPPDRSNQPPTLEKE